MKTIKVFETDQVGQGKGFKMQWSTYSTRPRPDWNRLNLDSFVDVVKTSLVDPAYGFIRNARINCGWKNGKKVKCGPNAIKVRKQRAEDRALDLANFLKSLMMNKQNYKGCIDCKFYQRKSYIS